MNINVENKKYTILISESEPQIVDSKKTFYIENPESKSPRAKSFTAPIFKKQKSIYSTNLKVIYADSILTEKVKKGESFDNIWEHVITSGLLQKKSKLEGE